MRVARAKTGKHGFVSFFNDYHGRTGGAAGVTAAQASNGLRPQDRFLFPAVTPIAAPCARGGRATFAAPVSSNYPSDRTCPGRWPAW